MTGALGMLGIKIINDIKLLCINAHKFLSVMHIISLTVGLMHIINSYFPI